MHTISIPELVFYVVTASLAAGAVFWLLRNKGKIEVETPKSPVSEKVESSQCLYWDDLPQWFIDHHDEIKALYAKLLTDLDKEATYFVKTVNRAMDEMGQAYFGPRWVQNQGLSALLIKGINDDWIVCPHVEYYQTPPRLLKTTQQEVEEMVFRDFKLSFDNSIAGFLSPYADDSDIYDVEKIFFAKLSQELLVSRTEDPLDQIYLAAVGHSGFRVVSQRKSTPDEKMYGTNPQDKFRFKVNAFLAEAELTKVKREKWAVEFAVSDFFSLENRIRYMLQCGEINNVIKLSGESSVVFHRYEVEISFEVTFEIMNVFNVLGMSVRERAMKLCLERIIEIINAFLRSTNDPDQGMIPALESTVELPLLSTYVSSDGSAELPRVFKYQFPIIPVAVEGQS